MVETNKTQHLLIQSHDQRKADAPTNGTPAIAAVKLPPTESKATQASATEPAQSDGEIMQQKIRIRTLLDANAIFASELKRKDAEILRLHEVAKHKLSQNCLRDINLALSKRNVELEDDIDCLSRQVKKLKRLIAPQRDQNGSGRKPEKNVIEIDSSEEDH